MKLTRVFWILPAVIFMASCATKPPVPAPEPEPEPIVVPAEEPIKEVEVPKEPEISKQEVSDLLNRVIALRKDAFDLGLKDLFPEEYSKADSVYISGKGAYESESLSEAKNDLEKAETLFSSLIAEGLVSLANKNKNNSESAKQRALAADAEELVPLLLDAADDYYEKASAFYDSEDYRAAVSAYSASITAYSVAEKSALSATTKARIEELGFESMDSGNYSIADSKLELAFNSISSDPAAALDAADEALLRYRLVLAKGWELSAGTGKQKAEHNKLESEAIKAQVAVRAQYEEAKVIWDTAQAAYSAAKFEDAYMLFKQAEDRFMLVYKNASVKREAALAAMEMAKNKSQESKSIANSGDSYLKIESSDFSDRLGE